MKTRTFLGIMLIGMIVLVNGLPSVALAKKDQAGVVAAELSAIANQLSLRPETAIDLSEVSGEYCFNAGINEGGHMTHYAIDPMNTKEDVIDFVNAEPLMKADVKVDGLPRFPGKLGAMTPNQWYYLPAGEMEPHHGMKFSFPLLIRASNLK